MIIPRPDAKTESVIRGIHQHMLSHEDTAKRLNMSIADVQVTEAKYIGELLQTHTPTKVKEILKEI